jgi:hypothetical protein
MSADEPPVAPSATESSPTFGLGSSVLGNNNGGAASAAGAGAVFSGSLSGFPLPDLLELRILAGRAFAGPDGAALPIERGGRGHRRVPPRRRAAAVAWAAFTGAV